MPKPWEYGEQYVDNKCPSLGHSLPMLLGHYKTIYRQLIFAGIFGDFTPQHVQIYFILSTNFQQRHQIYEASYISNCQPYKYVYLLH